MEIVAIQLDLGRQKERKDFILDFAEFAKKHGYNTIILYLEACVRTSVTEFFDEKSTYSLAELSEIVNSIEQSGLNVIPAFENFFHMEKFFVYPELAYLSEFSDEKAEGRGWSSSLYPRGAVGCISNPELNRFMDAYITEVSNVFHSKYVHMGLDEVFEFGECARCKKAIASGSTKEDMFFSQVIHNYNLAKSLGKEMMMWDDFFEYYDIIEKLPRDIIFCNWNYGYVADEPKGHWTNRVKRDWFSLYDELGFRYMFCAYGHEASPIYNVNTYTEYALKHHPIGALLTTWERSDCFLLGMYPEIAYAGELWSGKAVPESAETIYTEITGDSVAAKAIIAIPAVSWLSGYNDITRISECNYYVKDIYASLLNIALPSIEKGMNEQSGAKKDVLSDIFAFLKEQELWLKIQKLGNEWFDNYEKQLKSKEYFLSALSEISDSFNQLHGIYGNLWKTYRNGIESYGNALANRINWQKNTIDALKKDVQANDLDKGVLFFDCALPDAYASVKGEFFVKYKGDKAETLVYSGAIKHSVVEFDVGACYTLRMAIDDRPIEYAVFGVYGEGAVYPLNLHYFANGRKYYAKSVEKISGFVQNERNMLYPDARFALMGYESGLDHLNNVSLSKKRSSVRVVF
mgnify:CR=1 FL=1